MRNNFKNIIITGGAGFIGFSLINSIYKSTSKIFVIDNFSTGYNKNFPKNVRLIKGDCKNYKTFEKLKKYNFDSLIHLAGVSSVEASFDNPEKDANSNIISTLNVLRFVKEKKIRNFIFSSSMCVYGNLQKKVTEKDDPIPMSFYGISKLTSEQYIKFYPLPNTTKVVLRLFNVYGPGHDQKSTKHGMVGIYLNQINKNNKVIVKGKLTRFRDFIYINDVLMIIKKSMNLRNKNFNLFNVCTSKKTYIKDLINKIFILKKLKPRISVSNGTPGDQFGIYGSNIRIRNFFKIKKFKSLKEGLEKVI